MIKYTFTTDYTNASSRKPFAPSNSEQLETLRQSFLKDGRLIKHLVETTLTHTVITRYFDTIEDCEELGKQIRIINPAMDQDRKAYEDQIGAISVSSIEDLG